MSRPAGRPCPATPLRWAWEREHLRWSWRIQYPAVRAVKLTSTPPFASAERKALWRSRSRLEYDLHRTVLLLLEDVIGVRSLIQGQNVGGEVVDAERIVVVEQRHDVVDPALDVGLPHPQRQLLVEKGKHR